MASVGKRKRMLADDLAELFNPAPAAEVDPDAFEHGGAAAGTFDDAFDDDLEAPAPRPTREAGLRLRSDIDLDDAEYRGKKTTRAAMFGDTGNDSDSEADTDGSAGGASDDEDDTGDDDDLDAALGDDIINGVGASKKGQEFSEEGDGFLGTSGDEEDAEGIHRDAGQQGGSNPSREVATVGSSKQQRRAPADAGTAAGKKSTTAVAQRARSAEEDEDGAGEEDNEEPSDDMLDGNLSKAAAAAALGGSHDNEELRELEAAYRDVRQKDEAAMVTMRQRSDKERVKGLAVRNQQVLYERSLEVRILLQKCLVGSNSLPRPQAHAFIQAEHPQLQDRYSGLRTELLQTLGTLMQLQETLTARVPGVPRCPAASAAAAAAVSAHHLASEVGVTAAAAHDDDESAVHGSDAKRRRLASSSHASTDAGTNGHAAGSGGNSVTLDVLWQGMQAQHAALAGFRDSAVDRWQRRTALSSGSVALRSHLRALHQSVSSQVSALLKDPTKALKRSRLPLSLCPTILCQPAHTDKQQSAQSTATIAASISSTIAAESVDPEEGPRDEETFDDAEFYQQLLKEFLETQGVAGAGANMQKGAKKRKLVDRRASKGRKIRYTVQDKLVNFMAPVAFETPPFAVQLFANLFGHGGRS